jgi:hypothetical protein
MIKWTIRAVCFIALAMNMTDSAKELAGAIVIMGFVWLFTLSKIPYEERE